MGQVGTRNIYLRVRIKKIKIHGASKKKFDKSENPKSRILKSPFKSHKTRPLSNRKTPMTKYPIGLAKNEFISFFKMANISIMF